MLYDFVSGFKPEPVEPRNDNRDLIVVLVSWNFFFVFGQVITLCSH